MVLKLINATEVRNGTVIIIEGNACTVKNFDVSKTGKHGHAKVRIEAIGIIDGKKKVIVTPGHERFEVPMILKRRAQVLSVGEENINVMDLESFETMDLPKPTDIEEQLKAEDQVEYWDIEGTKIIKRKA